MNRQLRSLFRVVPLYALSNVVTGAGLVLALWPNLQREPTIAWAFVFLVSHFFWAAHALRGLHRNRRPASFSLGRVDLHASAFLCAFAATTCGVGIWLAGPYAIEDGTKILLASYVPGLIATGVLVGITTPLVSMIWLVILTISACLMVGRLDFMVQGMTIALLNFYAVMLTAALMFASRMFVARTEAEIAATRDRQTLGLLLGDFEESASDWLWESDNEGRLTRAGAGLAKALATDGRRLIGRRLVDAFSDERLLAVASDKEVGRQALQRRLASQAAFGYVVVEAMVGGKPKSWRMSAKPLNRPDGTHAGWRGVGHEVTDARARKAESIARESHLLHLATHDTLTALPNRRAFLEVLERMHASAASPDVSHAVVLVDLDDFKSVNDSLGHSTGDMVLFRVASRLQKALVRGDYLARLGGDEFAVLMRRLSIEDPQQDLQARGTRLVEALRVPETVDEFRLDVRASAGGTLAMTALENPFEMIRRADIALYAAKESGRNTFRIYEPAMGDKVQRRLSMVGDLAMALDGGELEVFYQCQAELASMKIIGCEALLRWRHPRLGLVGPKDFIAVAEESGLIIPIGLWVLERACLDAMQWPTGMKVAVNVSLLQLESPGFLASVQDTVRRTGLAPQRLELEITESSIVRDKGVTRGVLEALRRHGFRIAIDDFGTGYSSLSQLRELPFDTLKLDRSFVAALGGEHADSSRAIIASLLQLSASMNLSVTAEGVETHAECTVLRDLSCQHAQGYLLAVPEPQHRVRALLRYGYLGSNTL